MGSAALEIVPFYEDQLQASRDERGGVWVVVRRVCEALGIDHSAQVAKLKNQPWAVVATITTTGSDGKAYEMSCVSLETLPMWLVKIEPSRVAEIVRPKLERYQKEAARVLAEHFLGTGRSVMIDVVSLEDKVVKPILEKLGHMDDRLVRVENRVEILDRRVELHLTHKRKTPSAEVDQTHEDFCRARQRECPFCDGPLFEDDKFIGVTHHHEKASDARLKATMATCAPCNRGFNEEPAPRYEIDRYHARQERWLKEQVPVFLAPVPEPAHTQEEPKNTPLPPKKHHWSRHAHVGNTIEIKYLDELNEKELYILLTLRRYKSASISRMAAMVPRWQHEDEPTSWVRNSVRKLWAGGLIEKSGSGTYRITDTGRAIRWKDQMPDPDFSSTPTDGF